MTQKPDGCTRGNGEAILTTIKLIEECHRRPPAAYLQRLPPLSQQPELMPSDSDAVNSDPIPACDMIHFRGLLA